MAVRNPVACGIEYGRAAQELGLRRGDFDLAVQLGHVRTATDDSGGPPRVDRQEIDRLRGERGFPDTLRERLRTVGTADGAALASISQGRFLRLARAGRLTPARFYVNRYHSVVWLYLAEEIRDLARDHAPLLRGTAPPEVRALLAAGEDRRPRNWRGRRLGRLLEETSDPWRRAAAVTAVLDPVTITEVVPDPYERSYLRVLRPDLVPVLPRSQAGREIVERLLTADHPDEIAWHRVALADALRQAREHAPAPRPAPGTAARHVPRHRALTTSPVQKAHRCATHGSTARRSTAHGSTAHGSTEHGSPTRVAPPPGRSPGAVRGLVARLWRGRTGRHEAAL